MKKDKNGGNNRGILFVEAVLATVIFLTGVIVIIPTLISGGRSMRESLEYGQAMILAENKMFELLSRRVGPSAIREEGAFPDPYQKYRFRLETLDCLGGAGTQGVCPEDVPNLHKAILDVLWHSRGREEKLRVETLFLRSSS